VEHDEDIMKADMIIDIGPEAGSFGGELVAQGTFEEILKSTSLTAKYLNGEFEIAVPKRAFKSSIDIRR
jgi:excinuclease ABC subunit A